MFLRIIAFEKKNDSENDFLQVGLFYSGFVSWVGIFYAVFEIRWGYFTPFFETGGVILRRFGNVVGVFLS